MCAKRRPETEFPRSFPMVADMMAKKTGRRVSPQAIEQMCRKAIAKMRKELEKLGVRGVEDRE